MNKTLFLIFLVLGMAGWGYCSDVAIVSTQFETATENGHVTIVKFTDTNFTGSVVAPPTINGLPVTTIGRGSFMNCTYLTNVTIPDGVTSIESYAFRQCRQLASIVLPSTVTSIEGGAFDRCIRLRNITIPNKVTEIRDGLFKSCRGLTQISIPASVTSIGNSSFAACSGLTSVRIPKKVRTIGDQTFYFCKGLNKVIFEGDAPLVGKEAFNHTDDTLTLYFQKGSKGFSSPIWTNSSGESLYCVVLEDSQGSNRIADTMISDQQGKTNRESIDNPESGLRNTQESPTAGDR